MTAQPLISVIMGSYNSEKTLKESIDSIINQTYKNWELVICDDCSTDKSYEIAKLYKEEYPQKITLIRNEVNLGLAGSLNKCLEKAKGFYIARQDADDISMSDRFFKQIKFLEENPEYDLVGTSMISFDENGDKGVRGILKEIPDKRKLAVGPPFCHATIMVKADVYKKLGGYRVTKYTRRCEDIDLWFRFFQKGYKGINMKEPLYKVRDDEKAYKRRGFKSYMYATKVCFDGYRLLKIDILAYIYLLKPIIAAFIPQSLKQIYHKKKIKS